LCNEIQTDGIKGRKLGSHHLLGACLSIVQALDDPRLHSTSGVRGCIHERHRSLKAGFSSFEKLAEDLGL
jgi:hypothetical protein